MKKRVRFLGLLIVVLFSLSGCAAAGGKSLSCEADGEAAPAPVPAPKLLDVETGALEITGAPLDGLELDFIREEFKDIAALKEREDAAYRRGEAAAPSTLGVLAFSCDLDENGQTDYLAFPVGFGYTATMDQHSTGVFFVADAGGYRTFSGVPFAAVHSLKIYLLESKTGGCTICFAVIRRGWASFRPIITRTAQGRGTGAPSIGRFARRGKSNAPARRSLRSRACVWSRNGSGKTRRS